VYLLWQSESCGFYPLLQIDMFLLNIIFVILPYFIVIIFDWNAHYFGTIFGLNKIVLPCLLNFGAVSWLWSYGSWIYNYLCNQCLPPLKLWVWTLTTTYAISAYHHWCCEFESRSGQTEIVIICLFVCLMVFNNISAISWWSILLVEETGVPGENHRPVESHCMVVGFTTTYAISAYHH
jgi:hypothetical protein